MGTSGRREEERPKFRWINSLENDLKWMGVKRWRNKAEDRTAWAIILKEALVKIKCLMPVKKKKKKNTLGLCRCVVGSATRTKNASYLDAVLSWACCASPGTFRLVPCIIW